MSNDSSSNAKKSSRTSKVTIILCSAWCFAFGLGGGVWWSSLKQQGREAMLKETPHTNIKPDTLPMKNTTDIKKVKNSADLAKAKGVDLEVKRSNGTYSLVSVIEGVVPNRQLTSNLTLVSNQRRQLAEISANYNALPETAPQERELYAGQINELKKLLTNNLKQMGQAYAYSLNNEYILVPHSGSLHAVNMETKEVSETASAGFKTSAEYDLFQRLRGSYVKAQQSLALAEKAAKEDKKDKDAAEDVAKFKEELNQAKSEFKEEFDCEADGHYQMNFSKTALYARAIQR